MPITQNEKIVFLKKGKVIEENIIKLFKDADSTTEYEDINSHVDIKVHVGIDVKGLKKVNRSDQETNENYHWIEIRGVKDDGWLYGGGADCFAFEIKDYWLVVDKIDLQSFIAEKCREKIRVSKPELYKLYQRKERKDIITLVS